ncbi:MAG TPA: fibronectin type III domain-containing protein, partial [Methylomirabilota bacterium]|nr:fibronectin type III domain-containing protein [Methylomirabilota bacterium]
MRVILSLLIVAGSLFFAAGTQAVTSSSVTLAWDPSPSQNVAGYKIYYGTSSGSYITAVPVANLTNVTIRGLNGGTTYYFAATSYDSTGAESDFSPEISDNVGATVITGQPSSQSSAVGQNATFSVSASGSNLSYQW